MTSTNDGKEVKSYQTSGPKGKTYFIELYKSLEARLTEATVASERTQHLCEAWRRVHNLCQHSALTAHSHLLSWLQRHTARTVLPVEWQLPERKEDRALLEEAINVFIVESRTAAASRDGFLPWEEQLVARGEWFKRILEHPWKHPVLSCLLNTEGTPPTDDEVLEWLKEERGVTFVMRLHTLVAEKCDDIAISLAGAVMDRVRSDTIVVSDVEQSEDHKENPEKAPPSFGDKLREEAGFTVDIWEMLTDIEFVLLHKRDSNRCIALAKQTPLRSAYQLIERLQSRLETSPREKRLWKYSKEVAVLIAQVVIARCMVVPVCGGVARSALYCCARSLARLTRGARLPGAAAALAAPAPTAAHLHTLAAAMDAQLAQKNEANMKPFVCELYVRAITAGMNELERLKLKTEKDTEARSMEATLANWFVQLGGVLASSDRVKCECALTAFSVHPSPMMYERIKAAPALPPIHLDEQKPSEATTPEFGSWASDSRGQSNFVKTSETLNMKARKNQANVLSTAILSEGEALGLSSELCQDIIVLLSGPRVKTLSWDMDRELLLENCRAYLERTHGGTKAVTTELKYLNLNPDDFQYLPEEDEDENNIYYGIEKGYEHLVEFQEPEDLWQDVQDVQKSGSSYSSEEFDFVQPQRRRKSKKTVNADEDEDDPLSFAAETKRKEKKERPHSKERSKDKKKADPEKKSTDPLEISEGSQEKKEKPKRGRKKKEKPSLSNLVGLKVGRKKAAKHTDSDADSQKSAQSYSDVLYDGTFSMDEMRSPSSLSAEMGPVYSNGRMGTTPYRPYRPQSVSSIRIASPSPSGSYSASEHSRNNSPTQISNEVKTSISKLLEYRRQKAMELERKKPNAIIHPEGTPMDKINISPKAVTIPEIPKSYISKQSDSPQKPNVDHLSHRIPNTAIPSPVIQYASKVSPEKPKQSHFSPSQYQGRMTPSDRCYSTPPSSDRFLDNVNLISIYDKNEPSHSRSSYKPPYSNVRAEDNDMSHVNYQDYLHEYSLNSYNQYLGKNTGSKKVMRPTNRVTPVIPHIKSETRTPKSAKQTPLKKPDGSLNTFSRMSYYKNKQTDLRKSQELPQSQPTVDSKLTDGFIMNHLLQSDNTKPYSNPLKDYQTIMKKYEPPQANARDHPVLSNILQTNTAQTESQEQRQPVSVKTVPSEKDQNDLLLLLRQQKTLNMHNTPVATPNTFPHSSYNVPIASGSKTKTSINNLYDPNNKVATPRVMPNQHANETSPNESTKTVNDRKAISVLSTSIIKAADQKPSNSKPKPRKPTQGKPKTESKGPKNTKPVVRKDPEEWENVMDAILKQKTPYRGPKALEMTLNQSSFEKVFMDSLQNPTNLFTSPNKTNSVISRTDFDHEKLKKNNNVATSSTSLKTQKHEKIIHSLNDPKQSVPKKSRTKKSNTLTVAELLKQRGTEEKTIEKLMQQNKIHVTKRDSSGVEIKIPNARPKQNINPKPDQQWLIELTRSAAQHRAAMAKAQQSNLQQCNNEQLKNIAKKNNITITHPKQIENEKPKKDTKPVSSVQVKHSQDVKPRQIETFVSSIPNSDYDLLDELMDDDLRKEIGELSSDEESYNTTPQNYMKNTKTDEARVSVVYNESLVNACKIPASASTESPKVCKHQGFPQTFANIPPQQPLTNKEALKMTLKPSQKKPTTPLNTSVQSATHVVTTPTQIHTYSNRSLLRTSQITVEPNVYIKATRPSAPNVMLIPSNLVYEGYSIQSTVQTVPNLTPNTFIAVSSTPNISLYQATQFAAPVVTPVIIANAVAAPIVNVVPLATTLQPRLDTKVETTPRCSSQELPQQSHFALAQGKAADVDKLDVKATSSVPNHAIEKDIQKLEIKVPVDENVGKTGERKVLKEVQEKHTDEKTEVKRRVQKVIDKDIKLKTDQERVKRKRMAILNRKIDNFCGVETIALGYSPLQLSTQTEKNDPVSDSKDDLILSNQINLQDQLREEIKSPATPDSYKENKSEPVRRILLRSSNKLKVKVNSPSTSSKPSLDKKHKGPLVHSEDTPKESATENKQSAVELNNKSKRVSKRTLNKSVAVPKDTEMNITKVNSVKTSKTPKKNDRKSSNNLANTTPSEDLEPAKFFDIEAELLGSTIPKIAPAVSLDRQEISLEKSTKDTVQIFKKEETNQILEKVETNTSFVQEEQQSEDQSFNETLKSSELNVCKEIGQSVTSDLTTNKTDLTEVKRSSSAENTFKVAEIAKTTEEKESIVKEFTAEKTISKDNQSIVNLAQSEKNSTVKDITIEKTISKENQSVTKLAQSESDENTSNDQQILDLDLDVVSEAYPSKLQVTHTTVNVNEKRKIIIANEAKDKTEHCAKVGSVHNTSHNVVQPPIQKSATINVDDDDDIQIVGCTPKKANEKLELSQAYLDQVVIETIKCKNNDPRVKTVSIKLPNGKSFKGVIRGACSVANILENTKIKSHLVSLFQQKKKKYSIRLDVDKDRVSILPNVVPKKPQGPIEVVNLLSDDEDDKKTTQEFKTEYGKYKIKAVNNDLFMKHQTKLNLKTFVPVVKLLEEEVNAIKARSKASNKKDILPKTPTLQESIALSDINTKLTLANAANVVRSKKKYTNAILDAIPSKFVKGVLNDVENMLTINKPIEEPIVLIDDSSNDSVTYKDKSESQPQEKLNELKNMLLKDLGVVNLLSANNGSVTSKAVKLKDDAVIDLTDNAMINETEEYRRIMKRLCFIKLVRCDDMVVKLKSQHNITVNDNKTDENHDKAAVNDHLDNINEKADVLDDKLDVYGEKVYVYHDKADVTNDKNKIHDKFGDAQIDSNDDDADVSKDITDESVDKNVEHDDELDVYAKVDDNVKAKQTESEIDVQDGKADVNAKQAPVKDDAFDENDVLSAPISRSSSFSILDDLPTADEENQKLTQLDRSSPVMEIYELLASLKEKFPVHLNSQDLPVNVKCDTEWNTTKKCEHTQLKNLTAVQIKHQHELCRLPEVPKLTTLLLSVIQKEDLLQRYTFVERLPNSLKRKSDPSTLPLPKISKLVDQTEVTRSDDCCHSLRTDLLEDALNVDKKDVDVMFTTVTPEKLEIEDTQIIEDIDITPDLYDTDASNATISDCNDDDDTLTETKTEFVNNKDVVLSMHGNIPVVEGFNVDVSTSHYANDIFSADYPAESQDKSKINTHSSDSEIEDAVITSTETFIETLQESSVELSDDPIPIDGSELDSINEIEKSNSETLSDIAQSHVTDDETRDQSIVSEKVDADDFIPINSVENIEDQGIQNIESLLDTPVLESRNEDVEEAVLEKELREDENVEGMPDNNGEKRKVDVTLSDIQMISIEEIPDNVALEEELREDENVEVMSDDNGEKRKVDETLSDIQIISQEEIPDNVALEEEPREDENVEVMSDDNGEKRKVDETLSDIQIISQEEIPDNVALEEEPREDENVEVMSDDNGEKRKVDETLSDIQMISIEEIPDNVSLEEELREDENLESMPDENGEKLKVYETLSDIKMISQEEIPDNVALEEELREDKNVESMSDDNGEKPKVDETLSDIQNISQKEISDSVALQEELREDENVESMSDDNGEKPKVDKTLSDIQNISQKEIPDNVALQEELREDENVESMSDDNGEKPKVDETLSDVKIISQEEMQDNVESIISTSMVSETADEEFEVNETRDVEDAIREKNLPEDLAQLKDSTVPSSINLFCSEICHLNENQGNIPMNSITCEKTNLERNSDSLDNLTNKTIENDVQEPNNIIVTKDIETISVKVAYQDNAMTNVLNENNKIENIIAKDETLSRSNTTLNPKTNDEIVDALNKIFGESEVVVIDKNAVKNIDKDQTIVSNSSNDGSLNNSKQNGTSDDDIKSVHLTTVPEPVQIDSTNNTTEFPKTNDEIVDALQKMFGELEDTQVIVVSEEVTIDPQKSDLNTKYDDVLLRQELMDLENDTVVEDIVEMLSDDSDITIATVKSNTLDIKEEAEIDDCDATDNDIDESSDVLSILNQYRESNGEIRIKGIEYEDPVVGLHYVFSVIKEVSDINEQDCLSEENIDDDGDREDAQDFVLMIPKRTYSKTLLMRRSLRNMKRKKDMSDIKTTERKYRKGKNIDYPKISASSIAELAYAKEYQRIINYCSSIKFSYALPFHIDYIDVDCMLKSWPLNKSPEREETDCFNYENILYTDTEDNENAIATTDPLDQTLSDEILNGENISNYQTIDINEINFNKGFGERSGRVIQKIETGFTKLSAATLSDVKQYQPFSMSEVRKAYPCIAHEMDTIKVKLSRSTNLISLKEKIRSFFKKTAVELNKEWLLDKKNTECECLSNFPFGLTSSEFMEVPSVESIVNVVQVGQLPVTAAAQNPVTCDPRVTHVSDASPSQCSDNSPGVDTQASVETEYTELTTANITLPLVQEYTQNRHQSPAQEQDSPGNDDNMNDTSQTLSIVKIELMEEDNSQEKLENELYDNDFSPLPNNNVEYSLEDTSNNLFNAAGNLDNTANPEHTSKSNIFHTTSGIDSTFTSMFNNTTNLNNSYMDTTPSSAESTYTNMDNASASMYSTSPNMGNPSNEMENTTNMSVTSPNEDTTHVDNAMHIDNASNNMDDTYTNSYNPVSSDSNDMSNTSVGNVASNVNSPVNSENRRMDLSRSSNIENSAYDYSYENIEDYAANLEHNNNADDYSRDVDNYAASVENYSSSVDDFTSNVDNYTTGIENFASNVENYATNLQNYSTNVDNYTANIEHTNSNTENDHSHIDDPAASMSEEPQDLSITNSTQDPKITAKFEDTSASKINQIEHAMNAAGISSESVITSSADELSSLIGQSTQATANNYTKSIPINVMTLQQALSQVLPPPLNQPSTSENQVSSNPVPQQVLHIVQGSNAQTVINKPNGTHLLHIVQNKSNPGNGLSLVDTGLQQGGNQLIHIVNNGNQNNAQFLKRVNLLTNLTNAQGSNEQKMIQFVCKSADGKSIQLNTGHQRSMVLRLHPTAVQTAPKPAEPQDVSGPTSATNSTSNQDPSQDIKSRSMYEENYAQFIQSTGPTPGPSGASTSPCQEKATSLPKFNQVFGKQSYQENQSEMDHNGLQENSECASEENTSHLEQSADVTNPPLLVRNTPPETTQAQPTPAPQIKQTISPMNIHTTMHGGVIYTRQIPVNIGGGQTINLITVPSTELVDDSPQKQQTDGSFVNQESEPSSIIKLVPHHTANNPNTPQEETNTQAGRSNETNPTPQPPTQPVLTQMRIKLPMISKGPHLVPGTRIVRPSFFQIQRNVIPGTNPPVYQQVVLATAPPLGQTIRLPKPQSQPILVQTSHAQPHIPVQQVQHAPSSQHLSQAHTAPPTPQPQPVVPPELPKPETEPDSELSTLTLEQLREFDMVLEQVKERSVQPTPSTTPKPKPVPADSTDGPPLASTSVSESTQQVMYSVDNSQPTNVVSYVNRKSTITSATTSFVRSPDSTNVTDTPSSSTQVQITHTVTSKSSTAEGGSTAPAPHPKKKKKKKPSSSSSALSSLGSPSKTNALKPQEDEQTTQRILYILAEYKEQVENSPDKNKPAPRRRNQFPPTIGSKRKRSHCSSRAMCRREGTEMSPMHGEHGELGDDSLITLGSEDSSCGTTFSECTDCQETHSPEDTTKVVRRLTFEQETTTTQITQTIPPRNVIVGDRQTITVARTTTATTAKPTTTVLMPANYLLPVSMLKGGQQIAIMTNRGPKILVGAGDSNAGALLLQRLIGPGMKPVLARSGVRHIRLPTTSLHNLQGFNIQTTPVTQVQPPDSTAPQAPTPAPPDLVDTRAMSSPWPDREVHDKPERGPSPDCTEPWNLPSSSIADDYGYEEIVRTDNMERTVLDAIPDRYSPDMEAQRIFDKMFDVDSKKSMYDSSRCGYDIDTSDGDDKPFPQVVQQRKDGRHHRVTHVSTAALRHKYAILEHELRLQKSLSEECEDLGVDSPSASDLFPEADILFGAPSPAHEQTIDQCTTPPPIPIPQTIPQPDLDDQIATDQLLTQNGSRNDDLDLNLDDVGEIVTVGEDGIATIPTINAEEFARSHPNTTFHTEPEDGEIPPFTIAQSIKGRHITFHSNRVPGTVVMAPQTTVISQATVNSNDHNTVKFIDIDNMINSIPCPQPVVQSVLVKDSVTRPVSKFDSLKDSVSKSSSKFDSLKEPSTSQKSTSKFDSLKDLGNSHKSSSKFDSLKEPGTSHKSNSKFDSLKETSRPYSKFDSLKEGNLAPKPLSKFDSLLSDSKAHLTNTTGRQVVHSTGHGTQVIRRLRYDERNTRTNNRFHFEEPKRTSISDEVKMRNDRAMVESMGDNASSPGQPELFWDSATPERQERRFNFSESEKVAKSPFDELLNDSSAYGPHTRLDSVIKAARPERTFERTSFEGISVSGSSEETRPLRTYPPKRVHTQHTQDSERHFTLKTTTTTTHHHESKTTHHHDERNKKTLPRCQESEGRRRTGRGLVKRGCSCCNGSSAPPKKRSRPKKPSPTELVPTTKSDNHNLT